MRAVVVVALLAILLLAFSAGYGASTRRIELASALSKEFICGDEKMQDHVRQLMLGALDNALHEHITHVFETWMKDETQQPERARRGVNQGTAAFVRSREAVMRWKLPPCP